MPRGRGVLAVIALCVLGTALGRYQTALRSKGRVDALTSAVQSAVLPPARVAGSVVESVGNFWLGVTNGPALAAENRRLRSLASALRLYAPKELALANQIAALRRLMGMKNYGRSPVRADVLAYMPHESRLTLSVGSREGVLPGMAIVSPEGLVGTVQNVGPNASQGVLITSPVARVGAMVERVPPVAGILRGDATDRVTLDFLASNAGLQIGDWVLTSGYSDRIPRGLPIGRIVEIVPEPEFGSKIARVIPSANLASTHEVVVLR